MWHRRWISSCSLLVLFVVGACSSEEEPTGPVSLLNTEVTIASNTVLQGEKANALARFSATSDQEVKFNFGHSAVLGYRVISANGTLMMEFPREVYGPPVENIVRPGFDLLISINVPTARPAEEITLVDWIIEEDLLPEGDYTLDAGLYELEEESPWDRVSFTVVAGGTTR